VTLPSGAVVDIRIPNLAQLAKAGELDNDLLQSAIPDGTTAQSEDEDRELSAAEKTANLTKLADFHCWLVSKTLVEPKLTPEDVADTVPTPDIEVIVELASRRRDMDAIGHQIGGLEKSSDFRTFRGLDSGESSFLDV
jgi:hypothetical protein